MMNRYNETGTIINFSARTYMNHKCICTYASDDEKFHATPLLMIMVLCIALMENGCSILSVN